MGSTGDGCDWAGLGLELEAVLWRQAPLRKRTKKALGGLMCDKEEWEDGKENWKGIIF